MKFQCSMVFACCFHYSTSFSKNNFSYITNSTKEARLLRNDLLSFKLRSLLFFCPDLQSFTYYMYMKSKSCESEVRFPSHHFTGKSEQNIDTMKPFSLDPKEKTVVCGVMLSGKK